MQKKRFSPATEAVIDQANVIITEYADQGYGLTLRQLYYQFVARDLLPNTQKSYKRLGRIIGDARDAGGIDWLAIEDRTRNVRSNSHGNSPADLVDACADQFRYDLWKGQLYRPEVWIEKDALVGVFEPVCDRFDVPLFSCRGYTSKSTIWQAGQRLAGYVDQGHKPVILHFGDHPSGVDMTRDIQKRLELYSGCAVEVQRLALNQDQDCGVYLAQHIDQEDAVVIEAVCRNYRSPGKFVARWVDGRFLIDDSLLPQVKSARDGRRGPTIEELAEKAIKHIKSGEVLTVGDFYGRLKKKVSLSEAKARDADRFLVDDGQLERFRPKGEKRDYFQLPDTNAAAQ